MRSVESAFAEFAAERGLHAIEVEATEPLTPLLARAAGAPLRPALAGPLLPGLEAVIGALRFSAGAAVGAESDESFGFVVAITRIEAAQALIPRLFCVRHGPLTGDRGYGLELDDEAVWTESVALEGAYRITTSPYQDPVPVRELLAPAFIDWLAENPPADFSFELAYGDLVGSIEGDAPDLERLGGLWDATAEVAERIRTEALE